MCQGGARCLERMSLSREKPTIISRSRRQKVLGHEVRVSDEVRVSGRGQGVRNRFSHSPSEAVIPRNLQVFSVSRAIAIYIAHFDFVFYLFCQNQRL